MERVALFCGYAGVGTLSLRLVPQLSLSVYQKKPVNVANSVLLLELLTCVLFIFHAFYFNIVVMMVSNSVVASTVVVILVHNQRMKIFLPKKKESDEHGICSSRNRDARGICVCDEETPRVTSKVTSETG